MVTSHRKAFAGIPQICFAITINTVDDMACMCNIYKHIHEYESGKWLKNVSKTVWCL